jgi:hypothetical protein
MIFQTSERVRASYQAAVEENDRARVAEQKSLERQARQERIARQVRRAGAIAVKNSVDTSHTNTRNGSEIIKFQTDWTQISTDVGDRTAVEAKLHASGTRRRRPWAKPDITAVSIYTRMASLNGEIHSATQDYAVHFEMGTGSSPRIVIPPDGSILGIQQNGFEVQPHTEAWAEIDQVLEQFEDGAFNNN